MSLLAIAYSHEDLSTAQRIAEAVEPTVEFEHYAAGRANEGELLVDILRKNRLPLVVLVSHNFLTNPNCLLRAGEWLAAEGPILPIVVDGHRYDPDSDEVITEATRLANRSDITHYLSLWQDRYIELRRGGEHYTDAVGQHAFNNYLRKIRETSVGAEDVLEALLARQPIRDAELREAGYAPLYELAGVAVIAKSESAPEPAPEPPAAAETDPEPDMHDTLQEESIEEQVQAWISRAWQMSDDGDTAGGLELLHLSLENHPEELELHYQYALMLALAANRLPAARTELDGLLDNDPNYPDALFLSGELYSAAGEYQLARDDWEQLADIQPAYPEVNQRLGYLLADHFPTEAAEAEVYLRRATRDPEATGALYYRYAEVLARIPGRERKAIRQLEKAIQRDPEHAPAHYRLAVAQFDQGDLQQARKNYLLAVSLEPAYDTPANRRAFQAGAKSAAAAVGSASVANEALLALKQNIADLEAMLAEQSHPEPAPAARPGQGKTVWLSGATSGIGLATARRLAREGYRLIIAARRTDRLEQLAAELREAHDTEVFPVTLDVSSRDRVGEAIGALPPEWAAIDILINNAGKAKGFDPIHTGDLDHWDEMIDVNVRGLLYVTRAVTPGMVKRGRGTIINVASTAGKEVYPNGNVYCATKHAVDALTYAMRLDLVKHGIRVGQVCPAHVEETEFAVVRFDGDRERARIYEDFQPLRSRDVAETIYFMISQPRHVNIMDVVMQGTQQASSTVVDRSGRDRFAPAEEE